MSDGDCPADVGWAWADLQPPGQRFRNSRQSDALVELGSGLACQARGRLIYSEGQAGCLPHNSLFFLWSRLPTCSWGAFHKPIGFAGTQLRWLSVRCLRVLGAFAVYFAASSFGFCSSWISSMSLGGSRHSWASVLTQSFMLSGSASKLSTRQETRWMMVLPGPRKGGRSP